MNSVFDQSIPTPLGEFTARFSSAGLCGLEFPGRRRARSRAKPSVPSSWLRTTEAAVRAAVRGRAPRRLPPLDLGDATEFQRAVWAALRSIRPGTTRGYAELARDLGRPGAARAVGGACGANPIPLLIPCHRVLAAGGALGGFSCGLDWKRRLLAIEGVRPGDGR
jgi:O-6-methylguanine DNA methyltransferase